MIFGASVIRDHWLVHFHAVSRCKVLITITHEVGKALAECPVQLERSFSIVGGRKRAGIS